MSSFRYGLACLVRRTAALGVLAVSSAQLLAAPHAAPLAPAVAAAPVADAISGLLVDKGLADPVTVATPRTEHALVHRVRDQASDMVLTALNFLGVPYRRGGSSADHGFDCSGFTRMVFETSLGLVLPRRADEQANAAGLVAVMRDELQPGDLVFFNTLRRTFSHVGIYVGDGKFIHAPRPGGEVRVEDMRFVYWAKRFTGARRVEPVMAQAGAELQPVATALAPSQVRAVR